MRKNTNKSRKSKQPSTIAALALELGVSRQAVARHAKKPGAPGLADVPGWQEFLAANGREGTAPPELRRKIAVQRLRLLKAMATRAEHASRKERGELINKVEVQFAVAKGTSVFWSALEEMAQKLPADIKGCDERTCHAKLLTWLETARHGLLDGLGELGRNEKHEH
jgi:hypothetical protein